MKTLVVGLTLITVLSLWACESTLDADLEAAAVERQLALDDRVLAGDRGAQGGGDGGHQRFGLGCVHRAEGLHGATEALHPQPAVGIEHDLNDIGLDQHGADVCAQLPAQLFVDAAGGLV